MKTVAFVLGVFAVSLFSSQRALAQTHTAPVGYISYSFAATESGATNYLSAPLASSIVFTGAATTVGSNTLAPLTANWTTNQFVQAAGGTPYYVYIKTGAQAGRALRITANTNSALTVDLTDNSTQSTALNASGFAVIPTDAIEISAGFTLLSFLGSGATAFPGEGASLATAGGIGLWDTQTSSFDFYYFNCTTNQWVKNSASTSVNAGDTIIPPGATIAVYLPAGYAGGKFYHTGRAATVAPLVVDTGGSIVRYSGLLIPADMILSQINLGSNWTKSSSIFTADTLSVYDSALSKWDSFYQIPSGDWRKAGDSSSQDSTVIPAGSAVAFLKRGAVSGSAAFFAVPLPYTP